MKNDIIKKISEEKIIVIVRGVEKEKLIPMSEALYNGGIRIMEITYSANGSVSDEETAENINLIHSHFGDKMIVGAGTVINTKQVELTAQAGGSLIISPDAYDDVIKKTCELGLVSIPGAYTPTEIQAAHRAGADFVKIFPAVNLGPDYIKAVRAPLSHIKMLAVGGISENNMRDYLNAGISGFGIGTSITDKKLLAQNDYAGITELAKRYIAALGE